MEVTLRFWEIILDLKEIYIDGTEFLEFGCILHPDSVPLMLSSYLTLVHLSKLRNQHWYDTIY